MSEELKWRSGFTTEEASLIASGLYESYNCFDKVVRHINAPYLFSDSCSDEDITRIILLFTSSPLMTNPFNRPLTTEERITIGKKLRLSRKIQRALNDEIETSLSDSLLTLERTIYTQNSDDSEIDLGTSTVTKDSLAKWFLARKEEAIAKKFCPSITIIKTPQIKPKATTDIKSVELENPIKHLNETNQKGKGNKSYLKTIAWLSEALLTLDKKEDFSRQPYKDADAIERVIARVNRELAKDSLKLTIEQPIGSTSLGRYLKAAYDLE